MTSLAKQVANPRAPEAPSAGYAPTWYVQDASFDAADRVTSESTGAKVTELMGFGNESRVTTTYTKRGIVKAVAGSYGTLVAKLTKDADGLTQSIEYGDVAPTTTAFTYDNRRRLESVQTYRAAEHLDNLTSAR